MFSTPMSYKIDKALLKAGKVSRPRPHVPLTGKHEGKTTLKLYPLVHEDRQGTCVPNKKAGLPQFVLGEEA